MVERAQIVPSELEKLKKYLDDNGYVSELHSFIRKDGIPDIVIVYEEYRYPVDSSEITNEPPFTFITRDDKNYIRTWDAVCHEFSYGGKDGLLEVYGSLVDVDGTLLNDVEGWLTAEDIINKYLK